MDKSLSYPVKCFLFWFCLFSPKDISSLLLQREEGRERNINGREKHWLVASQVWTRDRTCNPSLIGWCSNQLSHTSLPSKMVFKKNIYSKIEKELKSRFCKSFSYFAKLYFKAIALLKAIYNFTKSNNLLKAIYIY